MSFSNPTTNIFSLLKLGGGDSPNPLYAVIIFDRAGPSISTNKTYFTFTEYDFLFG